MTMTNDLTKDAKARLSELRKQLQAIPEFREYEFLHQFVGDYAQVVAGSQNPRRAAPRRRKRRRLVASIPDAAFKAIDEAGHPLQARELVEVLPKYGKQVGGIDKVTNLSSTLSPDHRFVSVPWRTRRGWWLTGRDVPPDPESPTKKVGARSSADIDTQQARRLV